MTRVKNMQHAELMAWRKHLRGELLARRQALPAERLHAWRVAMDRHLQYGFPGLARGVVAFCWPIRNEYDARHLMRQLRQQGATAALPGSSRQGAAHDPEWHPGVEMEIGSSTSPSKRRGAGAGYSAAADERLRSQGYRLGYGGGFFDRTLESLGAHSRW